MKGLGIDQELLEYLKIKGLKIENLGFDELNAIFYEIAKSRNHRAIDDFEGLSPYQMRAICDDPFGDDSPLSFKKVSADEFLLSPLFCQVEALLLLLNEKTEIKLTLSGALPVKYVKYLYRLGLPDELVEEGISTITREEYCPSVKRTRLLANAAGLVKVRRGYFQLTRQGERLCNNKQALFERLLEAFTTKINLAYFDGFACDRIANEATAFSLVLLAVYGHDYHSVMFYADKYFKAFPYLRDEYPYHPYSSGDEAERCFMVRCFERFLYEFGLIEWEYNSKHSRRKTSQRVKASSLFYQVFLVKGCD